MTHPTIEKMARALAHAKGAEICGPGQHIASREIGWDPGHKYMDTYIERHWKEHVHAVTFALAALRNPPQDLLDVGVRAMMGGDADHTIAGIWNAMIDKMLELT